MCWLSAWSAPVQAAAENEQILLLFLICVRPFHELWQIKNPCFTAVCLFMNAVSHMLTATKMKECLISRRLRVGYVFLTFITTNGLHTVHAS